MTALPGAQAVSYTSGQASAQIVSTACLLLGWSALETSGTAATSGKLIDGGDTSGQMAGAWGAASGLADTHAVPPPGIMCKNGLYIDVASGAVALTVWVIPLGPGA